MLAVSISIGQLYRTRQELISGAMRKARSWHRCSSRWDRLTNPHLVQARARPVLLTKYHHACKGLINKEKTRRAGRGRGAAVRSRRLTCVPGADHKASLYGPASCQGRAPCRLTNPHLGQARARPVLLTKYHHASRNRITDHHLSRSNWQRSSFLGYPRWLSPYCRASAH